MLKIEVKWNARWWRSQYITLILHNKKAQNMYVHTVQGKTFAVFSIANISNEFLLNKLFYTFHARRDNLALGNRESFPVNGHLHTNRESFPTRKFCRIR